MNYMELALEEAKKAYDIEEVPIGAVIVKDGVILAKAHNLKETLNSSLAHAEILAIQKASRVIGDWRLNGAEMYVTLEPCAMCAAAIAQARISKLYIGAINRDMGSCGSVLNILDYNNMFNHSTEIIWNYHEKCRDILVSFFKKRRNTRKYKEEEWS